jgi:hypothetical protein
MRSRTRISFFFSTVVVFISPIEPLGVHLHIGSRLSCDEQLDSVAELSMP